MECKDLMRSLAGRSGGEVEVQFGNVNNGLSPRVSNNTEPRDQQGV